MEEKQNQILPNSIEEYEKEIKPRFGEAYVTAKRPIKFDVCSITKPKNEKFYILKFIYSVLDFIRIRDYKLRFKLPDGRSNIKFYAITREHMKEFTLQNLIFREDFNLHQNDMMLFQTADIGTLFYFDRIPRYLTIGGNKCLILYKDNSLWISKDFGTNWEKTKKKVFEVYKNRINKSEVENNYFNRFKKILNSFKSEKELYLVGFLNVVVLCDVLTYNYIFESYNHLWDL